MNATQERLNAMQRSKRQVIKNGFVINGYSQLFLISTLSEHPDIINPLSHVLGRHRLATTPEADAAHSRESKENAERCQHQPLRSGSSERLTKEQYLSPK